MPQKVPAFSFSDDALRVRQFLYEYWCAEGRPPNLREVHEATGLPRDRIVDAYKELDLGLVCVVDLESQNYPVLKMQPFSAYPTPVRVLLGGRFHSYAGCAMESIALSKMPPFAGKEVVLDSYCVCCLEPLRLVTRDGEVLSATPASTLVHVSTSPRDWNKTNIVSMCDSMNFVADASHAERYERQVCRRGVLFTLEQARRFVSGTAENRMWKYDWAPVSLDPERVLRGIEALGVDVSNWKG
ncbi:MAG: hypothetical protein KatS3mg076_2492 [Candidatus Binatia bacterium]|nr:MAG: hypothetical protein KatS3mg076_2492 [Candidatus Binatia bacterium]